MGALNWVRVEASAHITLRSKVHARGQPQKAKFNGALDTRRSRTVRKAALTERAVLEEIWDDWICIEPPRM